MSNRIFNPKRRTEVIEVVVSNPGASEFSIGSLPNLRNAVLIESIESFNVGAVPFSPSGKAVVGAAITSKSYLVLVDGNNTTLRQRSLTSLIKSVNGTEIPPIDCQKIDPEKSKITVPAGGTALTVNEVFLLEITYINP